MNTKTVVEHTPGPWAIIKAGSDQDDSRIIAQVWNYEVANLGFYNDPSKGESEANARLIASSPDLLSVCQRLIREYAEDGEVSIGCIEDAQIAVAKAEGRGE